MIFINTKDKLTECELKRYLQVCSNLPVNVCVPNIYLNNLNADYLYSQSVKNINDLVNNNIRGSLVGHSSDNENTKDINKKTKILIKNNLNAIICIGESKKNKNPEPFLEKQLDEILMDINIPEKIIIAYEPVWAIGGNKDIDIPYVIENGLFIRKILKNKFNFDIPLLYGGSVNLEIAKYLKNAKIFDGFLISSYALDVKNVEKIVNL